MNSQRKTDSRSILKFEQFYFQEKYLKQRKKMTLQRKIINHCSWKGKRAINPVCRWEELALNKRLFIETKQKKMAALRRGLQQSMQGALTLMMLSGALFMLRFLILTVSWWAVLQVRRYLLIRGLGNSVPSKCFSPKANKLRKGQ